MAMNIELRHLRYFVAVAEELHFGRAAIRLGIAQPPLSQQIQRLEHELGTTLFERSHHQVRLTDAGRVLLDEAHRILDSVSKAVRDVQRAGRGETGSLVVAFAASVVFLALPRIIHRFRTRFPDVRLELREMPTMRQLAALRSGEIDVGFVRQPSPDDVLAVETVMREPLLIAVSANHHLAARGDIELEALADEDFVLFPPAVAPGLHAQVHALCNEAGFTPRVVQESRELYTTVSLVEAGVGVTIVPGSVRKMGWPGLVFTPVVSPLAETHVAVAWRSDNTRPSVRQFLDITREVQAITNVTGSSLTL